MAKERIIYDNYDVCTMFDDARAFLLEDHEEDEITDSMVWEEVSFQDSLNWQDENERLTDFFTGHGFFLIRGFVGRWNGNFAAGAVFDNWKSMFYDATKDCDYVKIWDENGHFYLKCSHHDGTNLYEIKRLSAAGYSFIDNWEYISLYILILTIFIYAFDILFFYNRKIKYKVAFIFVEPFQE